MAMRARTHAYSDIREQEVVGRCQMAHLLEVRARRVHSGARRLRYVGQ